MNRSYLAIAALLALAAPAWAQSAAPNSRPVFPMVADLPACNDAVVLWKVGSSFSGKEHIYWASDLGIDEVVDIKEIGLNANGPNYIPRRYCVGKAKVSDGVTRPVVYQVEQSMGFAGYTVGVESCVVGFDRNFAYAPACSVLRPLVDRYATDRVKLTYP